MESKIKLGVSTCLLGERVRHDGGHKLDRFIRDVLGRYVEYVPVCPEVECGFSTPRESLRLVGDVDSPRLMTSRTQHDVTEQMERWARKRVRDLEMENLCGFIFKSNSPSSGMERIRVYDKHGVPVKKGVGVFARMFMEHFPLLPVEDDGRLNDLPLRENFIERVFAFKRWQDLKKTRGNLVRFHSEHKLLILSHSPKHAQPLGKLVAEAKQHTPSDLYAQYQALFTEALRLKATVQRHCNALQHVMGFFKKSLSPDEKQELLEVIDEYRAGYVPLIVPITLLNHYVRKYGPDYLAQQYYLHPHPIELSLRTHI